jgi:hypothetical protein
LTTASLSVGLASVIASREAVLRIGSCAGDGDDGGNRNDNNQSSHGESPLGQAKFSGAGIRGVQKNDE